MVAIALQNRGLIPSSPLNVSMNVIPNMNVGGMGTPRTTPFSTFTTPRNYSALNVGGMSMGANNPGGRFSALTGMGANAPGGTQMTPQNTFAAGMEQGAKNVYAKPAFVRPTQQKPNVPPNQLGQNLLNFASSPQGIGFARGLLEASGYSTTPVSFGQAIAQGLGYMTEADQTEAARKQQEFENKLLERELELTAAGLITSNKDTADIQNFKFYNNLPEAEQKTWDKLQKQDPQLAYALGMAKASASQGMPDGTVLTAADLAFDKKAGEELFSFINKDLPQQITNLNKIDDVINILQNENVTGPVVGSTPFALKAVLNPQSIGVEDDIRSIVFQSLRATLGAQFTEREGENLVRASFNRYLDEEINIKRLQRLKEETLKGLKTKESMYYHLRDKGTLSNYEGLNLFDISEAETLQNQIQQNIYDISDYANVTGDELLEIFESDISDSEKQFIENNINLINETYNLGLE
jgi:hypothetical protein